MGGLNAECGLLPIIDVVGVLNSKGNRRGIVEDGNRKELGTNRGERKNCNQSVELHVGRGGGNGK